MTLSQMPIADVVVACREETARFLRHELAHDGFCFELFRRAVGERDEAAWAAVFAQYHGMVRGWVRHHPAAPPDRGDDDYWLNRAFERFWNAVGTDRVAAFPNIAALLRYLKMCVHSVLLDESRARGAAPTTPLEALREQDAASDVADSVADQLAASDLWAAVDAEAGSEAERLVARLCFVLGLKPREIHERHSEYFSSVDDVYRTKRNLFDRLRRSPALRHCLP